jgi:hypothetical protein
METPRKIDMQPDTDAMRRHVLGLFGAATSGLVELAWISPGKGSGARLFALDQVDELAEQAAAWNLEGRNLYLGATLKHADTAPFARTSDSDAIAAWAVWLDLDEPGSVERAEKAAARFQPTHKITTGTVPHVRQHWWWRLDEPITDMDDLRAQVQAIAAELGGDPAVANPGRIMRLAGSIAWPTKPGRVAQVVTILDGGPVYTADMVARTVSYSRSAPRTLAQPDRPRPQPATSTGSLGVLEAQLDDGREAYMVATIAACLREFIGTTGAAPTADELYEAVWPQYDRKVDWRSRPGRGPEEFRRKVESTLRRFHAGRIKGLRNEEEAVASHEARQQANARPAPSSPQHGAGEENGRSGGGQDGGEPQPEAPADLARPFTLRPPAEIPRRRWLYGDSYIRSFVSVLASSGGAGKTTLYVAEALAIATGKPLLGITPAERTGVWIMNLEDPADEMERRIGAAAIHYGLDQGDIAGRLFVDAGRDKPLTVARQTRDGVTIHQPVVDAIVEAIRKNNIGVLIVDPFVASHSVSENDNQAINAVLALWRLIADITGCCIVLVHHVRKPNGEEMTVDSVRGGSAIIGAVRTARVMNPMSEGDAAKLGIEDSQRRRYVRVDNAKNNLAPPADRASWIELVSVDLGNGSGISDQGGDKVGVATAWEPPSAFEGVKPEHMRAVYNYLHLHGPQRAHPDADDRAWFGWQVMRICGIEEVDRNKGRVGRMLKSWVSSGLLRKDDHKGGKHRKMLPHYFAGEAPKVDE